jgi:hypothetical protein
MTNDTDDEEGTSPDLTVGSEVRGPLHAGVAYGSDTPGPAPRAPKSSVAKSNDGRWVTAAGETLVATVRRWAGR